MGLTLSRGMITPYGEPDWLSHQTYAGRNAAVGIQIPLKEYECTLYYYLDWERTDTISLGAIILSYFIKNPAAGQKVWNILKPKCTPEWEFDGPRSVLIYRDVNPSAICDFDQVLEQNIDDWNRVWKTVGGLKHLLKS